MSYYDIYQMRLNRFGYNYQERVQTEREKMFDLYLAKSIYKVEFEYNSKIRTGSLEKYQQTASKDLHYLLTQTTLKLPGGTVLEIKGMDGIVDKWMVFWEEDMQASGYNRYVMLRLNYQFKRVDMSTKQQYTGYGYLWGPQDAIIRDEITKAGRRFQYVEDNESRFIIMPRDISYKIQDYLILEDGDYTTTYRITGYDYQSVEGVEYLTLDPIFKYDLTLDPTPTESDIDEDFYWLTRGGTNGT